jgi:hypothetical protein
VNRNKNGRRKFVDPVEGNTSRLATLDFARGLVDKIVIFATFITIQHGHLFECETLQRGQFADYIIYNELMS